ncbi:hypothetical protein ACM66B_003523 [Microbotryomycetes sp. NB124-2]
MSLLRAFRGLSLASASTRPASCTCLARPVARTVSSVPRIALQPTTPSLYRSANSAQALASTERPSMMQVRTYKMPKAARPKTSALSRSKSKTARKRGARVAKRRRLRIQKTN